MHGALQHAEQCRQAVQHARAEGTGGRLRLGIIGSATYALLPRLIPSLRARYRRSRWADRSHRQEILEGLLARRFDAGLLRFPLLDASGFDLTPLDRDDFVLAVAESSPLAARGDCPARGAQARHHVPARQVPGLAALAMMRCQASGFAPRVAQEASQVQTIMSLVASGLGVGLVAGVAPGGAARRGLPGADRQPAGLSHQHCAGAAGG